MEPKKESIQVFSTEKSIQVGKRNTGNPFLILGFGMR
jgi:hypothetical protein